jgi:ABC-type phosphate transport system permease subunit
MFPITIGGKIVGAIIILSGVLILAFPLTILTASFQAEYDKVSSSSLLRVMSGHVIYELVCSIPSNKR